ncbi:MAG: hypothetical protein JST16_09185 [Bdellovibrionales bacterium]|nr:hypothetical protein [Bdellovibrionales bacterium]
MSMKGEKLMWSALPVVELADLVSPEPVERGLYAARHEDVSPSHIVERLVSLFAYESQVAENGSASRLSRLRYSPRRSWRRCSRIGQMIWIDTNHSFEPQLVIAQSRKAKLDPARVLRAVKVWRPYDAPQLINLLDRIPNPALWAPNTPKGDVLKRSERGDLSGSQALWWTPMIVIPDMLKFFCDPKLSDLQMVSLYRSFMIRLAFLRQRAIVLGLFDETALPARRAPLLAEMIKMARRVIPVSDPLSKLSQTQPTSPVERTSALVLAPTCS